MNTVSPPPKKSFSNQAFKLLLKIAITILCFWYISTKIDFSKTWQALLQANWWWLMLGVLLYAFSKFISAFRLNIYFRNIGLRLSEWDNIKLYWLGMFYNLFLPGGIGGEQDRVACAGVSSAAGAATARHAAYRDGRRRAARCDGATRIPTATGIAA